MSFLVNADFGGLSISLTNIGAFTFTAQTTVTAGQAFVVLHASFDNLDLATGSTSRLSSISDPNGNTWRKVAETTNSPGGVQEDGVTCAMWYCVPIITITASALIVVTISHGAVTIAAAVTGLVTNYTSASDITVDSVNILTGGATSVGALTASGLPAVNHLAYCGVAMETTAGALFSAPVNFSASQSFGIGTAAANATKVGGGYRTASNALTNIIFDPDSAATDWVSIFATFAEVGGVTTKTLTASLDTILQKTLALNASLDAAIQRQALTLTASLDATLAHLQTLTASADAILQKNITVVSALDAAIQKTLTLLASADASIQRQGILLGSSLDAIMQRLGLTATSSIDAVITGPGKVTAVLDAALLKTLTQIASIDAKILGTQLKTSTVDALLGKNFLLNADLTAVLAKTMTVSGSIEAVLARTMLATSAIDAEITRIAAALMVITSTLDAILTKAFICETPSTSSWSCASAASAAWTPATPATSTWH